MPPKAPTAASSPETAEQISLFKSIGLSQAKAAEAAKSSKSANVLQQLISSYGLVSKEPPLEEKQAGLIAAAAVLFSNSNGLDTEEKQGYVVHAILDGRLKSTDQVTAAAKYIESHTLPIDDQDFDSECGVGFSITPEDLYSTVADYIKTAAVAGWTGLGSTITSLKGQPTLRWANPLELKNAVEKAFLENFGPKETAKPKAKEPAKKAVSKPDETAVSLSSAPKKSVFEEGFLGSLHKPGGNPQIHDHLRLAHLTATKGQVYTRFPPEPNGYLHIGHSKAIFVNFGYAAHHGGKCYLRYDDTNPEAEDTQYVESILEIIRWLGYEPWKITYSSDYFGQLYDLAVELIKRDKAYVCHCTQEQIKADRGFLGEGVKPGPRRACEHRSRPTSESLVEFQKMKEGHYRPKEANLRMKQDLEDGNPQMWDLTAYRVLDAHHHRTGDKWKIYPTYDFTHCLVDSFENISHSLCTVEFIASRKSYDWLCDAVEVYKPRQSEYGRLSIEGALMSKRKILALVRDKHVLGWDDPRLYTLIALRRRGVPPGAITSFVSTLGVSTAPSSTEVARFDQAIRQYLENTVPRLLMVLKPLKVTIENLPEDYILMIDKSLHPKVPALGTTTIPFTRTIYIDEDDFRLEDSKDYFRLAPGKTVGLFQAPHPITCTSYKMDPDTGKVTELVCRLENEGPPKKPKAFVQWVAAHAASGSPVVIDETRIFNRLFKSDRPPADYVSDLNPDSLQVIKGAMIEIGLLPLAQRLMSDARRESKTRTEHALTNAEQVDRSAKDDTPHATSAQLVGPECIRFQGLRVAYFALDKDTRLSSLEEDVEPTYKQGEYIVLNRIVSLKEDSGKAST
jgi:glutaminyl-tRNA synthetase